MGKLNMQLMGLHDMVVIFFKLCQARVHGLRSAAVSSEVLGGHI